jgi:hypothetical protein
MKKIVAESTEAYDILGKVRNGGWSFLTGVRAPSDAAAIKYAQTWIHNNSKDCDQYAVAIAGRIIQKFPGRLPLREAASYIFTDEKRKHPEGRQPYEVLVKQKEDNEWVFLTDTISTSPEKALKYAQMWLSQNSQVDPSRFSEIAVSFAGKIIMKVPMESFLTEENFPLQYPEKMADTAPVEYIPVSLDQIVDRYLIRYEKESIPTSNDMSVIQAAPTTPSLAEGKGKKPKRKSNLDKMTDYLFEQAPPPPPDEEPPEEDPAADPAAPPADPAAAGGDAPPDLDLGGDAGPEGGGAGADSGSDPVVNTPTIDLNDFSRSVARLINNFDALLNPQTVILNRAKAYIISNYDERTAKEFMQILDINYGLRPVSTEYPEQHANPVAYGTAGISGGG